jgi:hypothetical protein
MAIFAPIVVGDHTFDRWGEVGPKVSFDGRQVNYRRTLAEISEDLGLNIVVDGPPDGSPSHAILEVCGEALDEILKYCRGGVGCEKKLGCNGPEW